MKITIGADHRGFEHKDYIKKELHEYEWADVGAFNDERSDYPEFAQLVAPLVANGQADFGVLICGSGVGMAIAANRFAKVYAALAWDVPSACLSREHDKSNVLVIPSDFVTKEQSVHMIKAWLQAEFRGGRYQKRIDMIDELGGL